MTVNLITALMFGIIAFVVLFALANKRRLEGKNTSPSELTQKITNIFRYTVLSIGVAIVFISLVFGWNPIVENDLAGWVTLIISSGVGIGVAISIGIYTTESQKKPMN